jgi:hypothetical protein
MSFLIEDIITAAKRSEFFPTSQATFSDPDDLIAFANEEFRTKLMPAMMAVRQEYFGASEVVSLRSGVKRYGIPERAIGNALKAVWYVSDTSDLETRKILKKKNKIEMGSLGNSLGDPAAFYVEGDEIVLDGVPSGINAQGVLFDYYERPSLLVPTTSCAKITAVSSLAGTTTLTVDTDLTSTLSAGSLVDFLSAKSPYKLWSKDIAITVITSTTIAVATSDLQDESGAVEPQTSDYICPAQQTNIPMIPQEFHPILAEMICYRALKALGATQKLQTVEGNIQAMLQMALNLMANRVEAEVDVVYDGNGFLSAVGNYGAFGRTTR